MSTQQLVATAFGLIALVFAALALRNRRGTRPNLVAARAQLRTAFVFLLVAVFLWFWR